MRGVQFRGFVDAVVPGGVGERGRGFDVSRLAEHDGSEHVVRVVVAERPRVVADVVSVALGVLVAKPPNPDGDSDRREVGADDPRPLPTLSVRARPQRESRGAAVHERACLGQVRPAGRVDVSIRLNAGHSGGQVVVGGDAAVYSGQGGPVERVVHRAADRGIAQCPPVEV